MDMTAFIGFGIFSKHISRLHIQPSEDGMLFWVRLGGIDVTPTHTMSHPGQSYIG